MERRLLSAVAILCWARNHHHALGARFWKTVAEFLEALAGTNHPLGGCIVFLVYALFWGVIIGALYRLFRAGRPDERTSLGEHS